MKYKNIREEELKNKIGSDWFKDFDTTQILGNIDFAVFPKQDSIFGRNPLLWAEAKTGDFKLSTMFVQLVLTIGKGRTFDKMLPPVFLAAFDFKKIAFVPYISVQDFFYQNDFNWNVTPSNHETKEFKLIKERIEKTLAEQCYIYDYEKDEKELKIFIKNNVAKATESSKIKIDKNNFIPIYLRWLEIIKPIIDVDWEKLRKSNIFDGNFYLADLFVDDKDTQKIDDDITIRDNLFVVFQNQEYKIKKEDLKEMFDASISIKNKDTYQQFWKRYKRPPLKEFQNYIIERKDLLVPQDIRERKGAFFTPRKWVELSQKYLADTLGENWQDEYYIWDCAAGTGNLLTGLVNKYNIWASTFDPADVNAMRDRIKHGANLLESHVFQFDFLDDEFSKLPQSLQDIINDSQKRKKLIIYINPPYAEATTAKTIAGTGENKPNTANNNKTYHRYKGKIGKASNELFTQFLARIYGEIPNSKIANFSKLKNLQASNFDDFRKFYLAKLEKIFLVPADTFDNVKGKFPIGFFIWDLSKKEVFKEIEADVFDKNGNAIGTKILSGELDRTINKWIKSFNDTTNPQIGLIVSCAPDFQHNNQLAILSKQQKRYCFRITANNLIKTAVYFAVRHSINPTWLNDRDQFLYPNKNWEMDQEFQNDCLTFALFDDSNNIQSKIDINNWIPFSEEEINAREKFESNFMSSFIKGKVKLEKSADGLFDDETFKKIVVEPLKFSDEANTVFNAGKEIWKYYHSQKDINVNASLYEIKEHFQGRNRSGKMNPRSSDGTYSELMSTLRNELKSLAKKIEPKVYEYGFLK